MEVLKVFNNNVVLACQENGRVVVATGRGLAYNAQRGDTLNDAKIQQIFVPDATHDVDELSSFLTEIPPEHLALAADILAQAGPALEMEFGQSMVIPLADHISFAIKRMRQNLTIGYPLKAEVAHLYPAELAEARRAVALIRDRTNVQLNDDEAVPIALHFVNAAFATEDLSRTVKMTKLFEQVFDVLETAYGRSFDTQSVNAARFITHMRYFFVRVTGDSQLSENPRSFVAAIQESFPTAYACAERVKALLELRLEKPITEDEVIYLTLHVARLANEQ